MQPTTQWLPSQNQQHQKAREEESPVTARLSRRVGHDFADFRRSGYEKYFGGAAFGSETVPVSPFSNAIEL